VAATAPSSATQSVAPAAGTSRPQSTPADCPRATQYPSTATGKARDTAATPLVASSASGVPVRPRSTGRARRAEPEPTRDCSARPRVRASATVMATVIATSTRERTAAGVRSKEAR